MGLKWLVRPGSLVGLGRGGRGWTPGRERARRRRLSARPRAARGGRCCGRPGPPGRRPPWTNWPPPGTRTTRSCSARRPRRAAARRRAPPRGAAYLTVTGPASAAVRLLALDPIQVSAAIARLAGPIGQAAARGARAPARARPAHHNDLPYPSAPALDLYAEAHAQAEVRLFAS